MAKDFNWVINMAMDDMTDEEKVSGERLQESFNYGENATDKMIKRWQAKKIPRGAVLAGALSSVLTTLLEEAPNNKVFLGTVIMGLSAALMNVEEIDASEDSFYTESESDSYH
jgi:hypothetical protein